MDDRIKAAGAGVIRAISDPIRIPLQSANYIQSKITGYDPAPIHQAIEAAARTVPAMTKEQNQDLNKAAEAHPTITKVANAVTGLALPIGVAPAQKAGIFLRKAGSALKKLTGTQRAMGVAGEATMQHVQNTEDSVNTPEKQHDLLPGGAADQALNPPTPRFKQNANPPLKGIHNGMPDYGYGNRHQEPGDTSVTRPKYPGFYGEIARADNPDNISGELGVNNPHSKVKAVQEEHPSMVPGMTPKEMDTAISGGKYTDAMYDKADSHAAFRQLNGQSQWAGINDKQELLPTDRETIVSQGLAHPNDPEK